ncbi:hypothetical protein [Baia soyae]|uniref:Uncharacterized protein n=1 Tax=Baia soyae TaxID=1544746 RepID=A0A4R2RRF5_9BACL|nr:hypothetical protein [Baia soyae]TCP65774.1 hypothetical protein EDD57_13013 [Baia soyae]
MNRKQRDWRDVLGTFTQVEIDQIPCPSCQLPVLEYQYQANCHLLFVWCEPCAEGTSIGQVREPYNKKKDQAKKIPNFQMVVHMN